MAIIKACMSLNFGIISPLTTVLAALERLKKKKKHNLVSTPVPSFLNGSSSFLQVRSTTIKSRTSLKFGPIRPWTEELAALERLKIFPYTYNWEKPC